MRDEPPEPLSGTEEEATQAAEGAPADAQAPPTRGLGGMQAAVNAGTTPSTAGGGAGAMDTGANAGAGPGGAQDVDPTAPAVSGERGEGGPTGSQDSGGGDLAEAGDV